MPTFTSVREAKEYLIAQILLEAEHQAAPLTETECKMMYWSESGWTLPDMDEVNTVFERDYDQSSYEAKLKQLSSAARKRAADAGTLDVWRVAQRTRSSEDHYLLVMLEPENARIEVKFADRLKLILTALGLCGVPLLIAFLMRGR